MVIVRVYQSEANYKRNSAAGSGQFNSLEKALMDCYDAVQTDGFEVATVTDDNDLLTVIRKK